MKIFLFFIFQFASFVFTEQRQKCEEMPSENGRRISIDSESCLSRQVAIPPYPVGPIACLFANEEFYCALGEERCDAVVPWCGTVSENPPPCQWNCWCKEGYKRDENGECIRMCPLNEAVADVIAP
ncbi:CLUMA_CG006721, isoform A [Clunio marinus]|uniref:CLUMA_CG006721, isoform A n=1 Tax=Clunio marinus TaxID=568069 RepID=A0A1J1I471_9DIPT|nr:CLUMA_CG006721, isoform A [Clunio marinus]